MLHIQCIYNVSTWNKYTKIIWFFEVDLEHDGHCVSIWFVNSDFLNEFYTLLESKA